MKAIYGHKVYAVNRYVGTGVELIALDTTSHEIFYVGCLNPELILNPTDQELQEAEEG